MSTKPPTAVMIPSVNSSGFKAVLDLLEPLAMRFELSRRRVVRLPQNGLDLRPVGGVRLRQRLRCALQLLAQPSVHARDVGCGQLVLAGLLVDEQPFRRSRARLLDILK